MSDFLLYEMYGKFLGQKIISKLQHIAWMYFHFFYNLKEQ